MADNTQKQMTPERAVLREIAERRVKDLESHKDCPLVDGEDIGDETCDLALQYHFARAYLNATAPLLVPCRECGGRGEVADYVGLEMKCVGVDCPACHGKGSVEREDICGDSPAGRSCNAGTVDPG